MFFIMLLNKKIGLLFIRILSMLLYLINIYLLTFLTYGNVASGENSKSVK